MTTPFWVGTSWKMNKTLGEAAHYAQALRGDDRFRDGRLQGFVIPPFTALHHVCQTLIDEPVMVGAQNMHWAERGAFTGEISPLMVKDCGATIVELGHSERREYFNESDAAINLKVKAALAHGLHPLICVGETAEEKCLGVAADTVIRQCRIALSDVGEEDLDKILIAYEPVWAIGEHGTPATADDAGWIHRRIHEALPTTPQGTTIPVLYGGSVNLDNCADFAALPEVAGLFIGRSAWQPEGLLAIAERVVTARFGD
ncbi:triose-phosphate isomerase [Billgrantia antri]|uniref:Triosephosphate isomerase n=1 Tax=Halomonas sulfidivorans TaxID=2733488 RepID=A0ABX7WKD7_9GAMM|nr:triose-phosphate isomerase [Halomonas sulfidivorans]QTP60406.1 triose-phosphate isomerase [Halomonas sulfidivorans]